MAETSHSSSGRARAAALALYAILAAAGTGFLLHRVARESRLHRFDATIAAAAAEYGVDPRLLWQVIRRESRFDPAAVGAAGEIGLMQVTEPAAREWAAAAGRPDFEVNDLFDPDINVRAGAWYLARALGRWSDRDEPAVFALAEYNAGRSNALRWAAKVDTADAFLDAVTYPTTRRYIRDIMKEYRRGR